jgi:hypothetical protein
VNWHVEWREGRLGKVARGAEGLVVDYAMEEKYAKVQRHFDRARFRRRNGERYSDEE